MSESYDILQAQKQAILQEKRRQVALAVIKALVEGGYLKLPDRMHGWGLASQRDAMAVRVVEQALEEQKCP